MLNPPETPTSRALRRDLIALGLLLLAMLAVFGQTSSYRFVWDDEPNILRNPHYYPSIDIAHFWREPYLKLYIPVAYTVWGSLVPLAGEPPDASVFHVVNVVLHALNVWLVYGLLRRVLPTATPLASALGAAIFALHPLQVEPVAWVSELRGLLSATLSFAAIHLYFLASHPIRRWRTSGVLHVFATLLFVMAMLSKPAAVAVPLVVVAIDVLVRRRSFFRSLAWMAPWLLIAAWVVIQTRDAQPVPHSVQTALWTRPIVAADTLSYYVQKLIWPMSLGPDYGRTPRWLVDRPIVWLWGVLPIALILLAVRNRRRWPELAAGTAIFVLAVLPVLGVVPFIFQTYSTVADRYVYLALIGPALGISWWLSGRPKGKVAQLVVGGVIVILTARSFVQVHHWQDTITLFSHALSVNPSSDTAHSHLAAEHQRQGNPHKAIEHFRAAVEIAPGNWNSWNGLGSALRAVGDTRGAIDAWTRAYQSAPDNPAVLHSYAIAQELMGNPTAAADLYQRSLALDPHFVEAHVNYAINRLKAGQPREAMVHLHHALKLRPNMPDARFNLAMAHQMNGELDAAAEELNRLLHVQPQNRTAAWNLAVVHYQRRDREAALNALDAVLRLDPTDAGALRMRKALGAPEPTSSP